MSATEYSKREFFSAAAPLLAVMASVFVLLTIREKLQVLDLEHHLGQQTSTITGLRENTRHLKVKHWMDTVQAV